VADDQVIKLLEEIRDLQKQQIENQQRALRREKIASIAYGLILLFFLILLLFLSFLFWTTK